MNLDFVKTRECLIIGTGRIPKNEIDQIVKEIATLSKKVIYSYLWMKDIDPPNELLNQIVASSDGRVTDYVVYDAILPSHPAWNPYGWHPDYIGDFEEDDLVVLWLVEDDPNKMQDQREVDFARRALELGRPVLVMNDGFWQVDRIEDDGMYERFTPPEDVPPVEVPDNVAVTIPSVVQSIDDVDPVPESPEPKLPTPAVPSDYDSLTKAELKALVTERRIVADKRSVHAMVDALRADDGIVPAEVINFERRSQEELAPIALTPPPVEVPGYDDLTDEQFEAALDEVTTVGDPITNKQSKEANDALFGVTDEDDAPMTPEQRQIAAGITSEPGHDLTDEEAEFVNTGTVINRVNEEANAAIKRLEQVVSVLDELAHAQNQVTLITTQLATVMLELKKELSGG